ncbi:hypothetical protein ILYODFUR_009055 [Ilyodon furcidens]|uniref:Uncharacterized protein n=1 Tax=Ilyodon furcidens TaxID=33524 RepID=A0ABV0SYI2_9TELE
MLILSPIRCFFVSCYQLRGHHVFIYLSPAAKKTFSFGMLSQSGHRVELGVNMHTARPCWFFFSTRVSPSGLCEAAWPDFSTLDSASAQQELLLPVFLQPFEFH